MSARMIISEVPHALTLEGCPCDHDFASFVSESKTSGARIFHFGTGAHHTLGTRCAMMHNHVLGITASPEEHAAYVRWAIDNPRTSANYQVLFGDIYMLNGRLLPRFDYITLFHLCEYWSPERGVYGAANDENVLAMMIGQLAPDGFIVGYRRSAKWADAQELFERAIRDGLLLQSIDYASLRFYRRRWPD